MMGKTSYPWPLCMHQQTQRYGSPEIARKVCGSIRARSRNPGMGMTRLDEVVLYKLPKAIVAVGAVWLGFNLLKRL